MLRKLPSPDERMGVFGNIKREANTVKVNFDNIEMHQLGKDTQ